MNCRGGPDVTKEPYIHKLFLLGQALRDVVTDAWPNMKVEEEAMDKNPRTSLKGKQH